MASNVQECLKEIKSLGKVQEPVILFSDLNSYYAESNIKSSSSLEVGFLFLYIELELVRAGWQVHFKLGV